MTLGTDIGRYIFEKSDCGTKSESDCDPAEVPLMEIVLSASPRRNILQGTIEFFKEKWRDLSNKIERYCKTKELKKA